MMGIDEQSIRALHVCDAQENLNKILQITSHDQQLKMPNSIEQLGTQGMDYVDLSEFKYFLECESHPVVKYAYSRGVTPAHFNKIMVCPKSNAVVFVVFKGMIPVGWQKRYLNPIENRKTKTSPGFKRGLALLDFPNTGPIAICEGPFTALSAWHFGYHGVCTFGSAVTDDQIVLLKTLIQQTDKEVVIAFDLDDAGKKGAQLIRRGLNNLIINDLVPETGNDLNESWMNKTGAIIIPYFNNPLPKLEFENEG
jgi:5S rRNA maturation endonuclease (ribonuclease M5)